MMKLRNTDTANAERALRQKKCSCSGASGARKKSTKPEPTNQNTVLVTIVTFHHVNHCASNVAPATHVAIKTSVEMIFHANIARINDRGPLCVVASSHVST